MRSYDFVAIGGGSAGLTASAMVKAAGLTAAVVDNGAIGGLCSLNGCNPKKVLVRSSEVLDEVKRAAEFGITTGRVRADWPSVIARKESFTSGVTQGSEEGLRRKGIDLIQGAARFVSPNQLQVNGETLSARGILVATGSAPRRLNFEGAELMRGSDDLLALKQAPKRLFIVGAGVIAMEFGQVFARLGCKVTMVTPDPRPLMEHDADLVRELVSFCSGLGMEIHSATQVRAISRSGQRFRVKVKSGKSSRSFPADYVLNAAGRPPAIEDLALENAGVERDARGVVVSEYLRSPSNQHVFAAGDARGRLQLSPVASYEGRIAARNFVEGDVERASYDAIPSVVYTIPPLAAVGLTEAAARERGMKVVVQSSDMKPWKVYAIAGEPVAHGKVIVDSQAGGVVGAHLLARGADEVIHVFAMAMRHGIAAEQLRNAVYAYPTFASAIPSMLPQ